MNIHVPKEVRRQFSIDVKSKLVERALSFKAQWEEERDKLPKEWNNKTKKWERKQPKWGYVRKTIEENFPDIRGKKNNVSCISSLHLSCFTILVR